MSQQRVVLITGVSSGFGRRMAETFARAGDVVFGGLRDGAGRNAKPRAELEALGVEVLELDVTNDDQVEAAAARAIERSGRIDVLVNNAGIAVAGLSECSTIDQARSVFETNYFGPLRLCRAVLPHMRRQRSGLIVHLSSIGGPVALPSTAHYGASKAAIARLGEVQHHELASFGIDVTIVEPGVFATSIFESMPFVDDTARNREYGPLAEKAAQGIAIAKQMTADGTPDPQHVADAVLRLAELPAGQRPLHLPVGQDAMMLEQIHAITTPLGMEMFKAFGFYS